MVGSTRVPGAGKMRSLVAVLLVCSSVVSQSAAASASLLRTRALVGDTSGLAFAIEAIVQADSKSVTPASEATNTPIPAPDTTAPETPAPATTSETPAPAASTPAPVVNSLGSPMTLAPAMLLHSQELPALLEKDLLPTGTSTSTDDTESGLTTSAVELPPAALKKPTPTVKSDGSSSSHVSSSASSSSKSDTSSSDGTKSSKSKKGKASSTSDSGSGSGSENYESGSGSTRTYACACKSVQKVSLMGQSDYCLAKSANVAYKCGNMAVKENGVCPRIGAQPCQETGHVLASDSVCAFDEVDSVYKCVASKEDLEIKKNGGKKKKNSTLNNSTGADTIVKSDASSLHRSTSTAFHAITLVATLALGIAALL